MTVAEDVLALATRRPPALGAGRLLCIDGPSGSGKSVLAAEVAKLTASTVVHTDDLCVGWDGIPALTGLIENLLVPLAAGQPGTYRRYDWLSLQVAEPVTVEPGPLLILEGVGAGARAWSDMTSALIWVDADVDLRQQRAFARDGDYFREYWTRWAQAEATFFGTEQVRARADLVIDTTI